MGIFRREGHDANDDDHFCQRMEAVELSAAPPRAHVAKRLPNRPETPVARSRSTVPSARTSNG
jgi:hypothetical protein